MQMSNSELLIVLITNVVLEQEFTNLENEFAFEVDCGTIFFVR